MQRPLDDYLSRVPDNPALVCAVWQAQERLKKLPKTDLKKLWEDVNSVNLSVFSPRLSHYAPADVYAVIVLAVADVNPSKALDAAVKQGIEQQNEIRAEKLAEVNERNRRMNKQFQREAKAVHSAWKKNVEVIGEINIRSVKRTARACGKLIKGVYEPEIRTGRKIKRSARVGHEKVHGTAEEKEQRWAEYQRYVNALHKKRPYLSYSELKRRAAEAFGVSVSTIKNHTENPKKTG